MPSFDKYEAKYEAAAEAYEESLQPILNSLIQPIMDRVEAVEENMPRPWTLDREWLEIWIEEGEDVLRDILAMEFKEEAEALLREFDPGPCCNDFHCPCGNTNNFRGF